MQGDTDASLKKKKKILNVFKDLILHVHGTTLPHVLWWLGNARLNPSSWQAPPFNYFFFFFIINTKADSLLGDLTTLSKTMCLLDIFSEIPD